VYSAVGAAAPSARIDRSGVQEAEFDDRKRREALCDWIERALRLRRYLHEDARSLHEDGGRDQNKVEHPEEEGAVHEHDSPKVNFGCSDPWFKAGDDGTAIPFYLDPASIGVLIDRSQTTSGMGVHPNDSGNTCISDLIWEADTLEPGVTPLKWKLSVPEAPKTDICQ